MKLSEVREGMAVVDRWFPRYGRGKVLKKLKTRVHVSFTEEGLVVYDAAHVQFLSPARRLSHPRILAAPGGP